MTAYTGIAYPLRTESLNNNGELITWFEDTAIHNQSESGFSNNFAEAPYGGRWDERSTGSLVSDPWTRYQFQVNTGGGYTCTRQNQQLRGFLYDQIHVLPIDYTGEVFPRISVGAITRTFIYPVQVWNAFLDPVTVNSTTYSASGVALDSTGDTLQSNEIHTYSLTIYEDGPSVADARVTLVTTLGDWWFDLVGLRTYAPPVWALVPVNETLQFKTWVFKSENGKEQRMDLRDIPRRQIDFESFLSVALFLRMQNIIKSRRNNEAAIPLFEQVTTTDTNYYTGDTVLTLDTTNADYYPDGYVGMLDASGANHFSRIVSLTSGQIVMEQALEQDFIAGETRIYPVITGNFKGAVSIETNPYKLPLSLPSVNSAATFRAKFSFETHRGNDLRGYVTPNTLGGYNIIPWHSENVKQDAYAVDMWEVDFDTGVILTGTQQSSARISRSWKTTLASKEEIWNFRRFCHTQTQRTPFWFSLNQYNLVSSGEIVAGATVLEVLDFGFYNAKEYRTALCIVHPDGTTDYREINTYTENGATTLLAVDALTNATTSGASQTKISFLVLGRITGDIKMQHFGYKTIASFNVQEVYQ